MMFDELLECNHCGVVGSEKSKLCRPILLMDPCLDHTTPRDRYAPRVCARMQAVATYTCGVCARPAIEALDVCYPRHRVEEKQSGEGMPGDAGPPAE